MTDRRFLTVSHPFSQFLCLFCVQRSTLSSSRIKEFLGGDNCVKKMSDSINTKGDIRQTLVRSGDREGGGRKLMSQLYLPELNTIDKQQWRRRKFPSAAELRLLNYCITALFVICWLTCVGVNLICRPLGFVVVHLSSNMRQLRCFFFMKLFSHLLWI